MDPNTAPVNELQSRVGARIRDLRLRRNWTQEMLGERAGMSYKFIGEVERGTGNPTLDSIEQIARAFSVDVSELFKNGASEAVYSTITASDFAVFRELREQLSSAEDVMKRIGGGARPRPRKRAKSR